MSILWKAFCFKDQRAADAYHDPAYNLTPGKVVDVFNADMKKKGVRFKEPMDISTDKEWMAVILKNYNSPEGSAY